MGAFFHGWRRKVGLLSLVMALVFVGFWIKSSFQTFGIQIGRERRIDAVMVYSDGCSWATWKPQGTELFTPDEIFFSWWFHKEVVIRFADVRRDREVDWRYRFFGIERLRRSWNKASETAIIIHHWLVVIPLTLLSAYLLLLSKPRISTQKKNIRPIPEKAA